MSSYSSNQQALLSAVKLGTLKCVQETFIADEFKKDDTWFDYKLLMKALKRGHKSIVNFLLNNNCRVRKTIETRKCTPLHYAITIGDINILRKLIRKDASINDKDNNQETPFYLAMRLEKFEMVDTMLSMYNFENVNPNSKDSLAHFHVACMRNKLVAVKKFIEHKFPINSHADFGIAKWDGYTPLHFAVKNRSLNTIRFLLDHNVDTSVKNSEGLTPIHLAYYNRKENLINSDIVDTIFHKQQEDKYINSTDKKGISHFHICCSRNFSKYVQIFINNGVDVNSSVPLDSDISPGYTPLHFAVQNNRIEVTKVLLRNNANTALKSKDGSTPLHLACQLGHTQIIELLLKSGADVAAIDDKSRTSLHCAFYAHAKNGTLINQLLSRIPKNINFTDFKGLSCFHIACTRNSPKIVENFLKNGVSVDLCTNDDDDDDGDYSGYSALHFAVQFNRKAIVQLLIQYNANVNISQNDSKITPLHLACTHSDTKFYELINKDKKNWISNHKDQTEIIELLLSHKADLNAKDLFGMTSLMHACKVNVSNIIKDEKFTFNYLERLQLKEIVLEEVNNRAMSIINILLSHNVDIHMRTDSSETILHLISKEVELKDATVLAEIFLSKGINVNATDEFGETPLHVAVEYKRMELIRVFLNHNANVNAMSSELLSPLHIAIKNNLGGRYDLIIETLLEKGSYINAPNLEGKTPVRIAFDLQNVSAIQLLLRYGADINTEDFINCLYDLQMSTANLYNIYSRLNVMVLLESHLKKLEALGLFISEKVKKHCSILRKYCNDHRRCGLQIDENDACTKELERMKQEKVDNYSSLFDILRKDQNEMTKHIKNKSLKCILTADNVEKKYPLYGYLLKLQFKRGLARSIILKPAKDSLEFVTGLSFPDSCSERIFKYLTNENLENLIKCKPLINSHKRELNFDVVENNELLTKRQRLE